MFSFIFGQTVFALPPKRTVDERSSQAIKLYIPIEISRHQGLVELP